ncbi:MAG TPA: histidine phosphatase family protein [Hyphomicrobiaceae bacterium]|nr:histidine phosphatase family protein [Hyphomicrobiaceae bacterium]
MPVIDLMRHGETERAGDLIGRTDCALSQAGWTQFERQTAHGSWALVIASPLKRACEAAERLGAKRGLPVVIDPDWREIDLGDWDGKALAELEADPHSAALMTQFYRDPETAQAPNGEPWAALRARIDRALARLAEGTDAGGVLVVTHGGPIRTALSLACAIPLPSLWALRIDPATRVRLALARHPERGLWGEILEVEQP